MAGFGTTGSLGNWNPPPLNQELLTYYNELAKSGLKSIGSMAGGAIGGGIKGGMNASTLEKGGALAPGETSGVLAGATQGVFDVTGGEQYKQLKSLGKSADAFVQAQAMGGDEIWQKLGIHPEQWKTMGAQHKWDSVQGLVQSQAMDAAMARLAYQNQETNNMKAALAERQAMEGFNRDLATGDPNNAAAGRTFMPDTVQRPTDYERANQPLYDRAMFALGQNPKVGPGMAATVRSLGDLQEMPQQEREREMRNRLYAQQIQQGQERIDQSKSTELVPLTLPGSKEVVGYRMPGSETIHSPESILGYNASDWEEATYANGKPMPGFARNKKTGRIMRDTVPLNLMADFLNAIGGAGGGFARYNGGGGPAPPAAQQWGRDPKTKKPVQVK